MGYDRSDSCSFDFEQNRILFGSKSKEQLSLLSYPIQFERKYSFLSVHITHQGWNSLKACASLDQGTDFRTLLHFEDMVPSDLGGPSIWPPSFKEASVFGTAVDKTSILAA